MKIQRLLNVLILLALVCIPAAPGFAQREASPIEPAPNSQIDPEAPIYLPIVMRPRNQTVFGVETYAFFDDMLTRAREADVYWIRSFLFNWAAIESQQGVYNWSSVDKNRILMANKYDMNLVANIKFTPSWAQKYPGYACSPISQSKLSAFGNFVRELVTKYGSPPYNIRYWELFNEPDVDHDIAPPDGIYGCWGEDTQAYYGGEYYAEMLKVAYQAIKSVNPAHQVLIGGLVMDCDPTHPPAGKNCLAGKFFEGILRNNGASYFDIVSFHSYIYTSNLQIDDEDFPSWAFRGGQIVGKVNFLREVMNNYGVDKPLLMTELAMFGADIDCSQANPTFLELQSDIAVSSFVRSWALGLKGQIWYTMEDNKWRQTGLHCYSDPKPAYYALEFLSNELKDATVGNKLNVNPSLRGYEFHLPDKDVWVLWTPDGDNTVNYSLPAGVTHIFDKFGETIHPIPAILPITHATYLEFAK